MKPGETHDYIKFIRQVGFLKRLNPDGTSRKGSPLLLCECLYRDCGKRFTIRECNFKRQQSCGCLQNEQSADRLRGRTGQKNIGFRHRVYVQHDYTGRWFGMWFVLKRAPNSKPTRSHPHGSVRWLCRCCCEAKSLRMIRQDALEQGTSRSCCGAGWYFRREGLHRTIQYEASITPNIIQALQGEEL